jgi:hypothetical protein
VAERVRLVVEEWRYRLKVAERMRLVGMGVTLTNVSFSSVADLRLK